MMSISFDPALQILWQDEWLLAVNKPSGLLAIQDGYQTELPHVRQLLEPQFGRLYILHRLDRETSGIMLLARTPETHKHLSLQFEKHAVRKTYLAIVPGQPDWQEGTVDLPLRSSTGRRKRTTVDFKRGKPAKTSLEVISAAKDYSLIQASPHTGRTHQIRAHLYASGFPILGDSLYGDKANYPPGVASRLALHALNLSIQHPATEDVLAIAAPLHPDFFEMASRCSLTIPNFALRSGKI